ncbi:unnamed protein product, partial [Ectocarpus sp. 12 AP-2014]
RSIPRNTGGIIEYNDIETRSSWTFIHSGPLKFTALRVKHYESSSFLILRLGPPDPGPAESLILLALRLLSIRPCGLPTGLAEPVCPGGAPLPSPRFSCCSPDFDFLGLPAFLTCAGFLALFCPVA